MHHGVFMIRVFRIGKYSVGMGIGFFVFLFQTGGGRGLFVQDNFTISKL